jgi:hypothetical protein
MKLSVYNSASLSPAVAILVTLFSAVSTSVGAREFSGTDPHNDGSFETYEFAGLKLADSGVR